MPTKRLTKEARADLLLRVAAQWQMGESAGCQCDLSPRWCGIVAEMVFWALDNADLWAPRLVAASLALSEVCGMGYDLEDAKGKR